MITKQNKKEKKLKKNILCGIMSFFSFSFKNKTIYTNVTIPCFILAADK
jgi:hypothetical protein